MGVRVISGGLPTTIPCNVCDKELEKDVYEGTHTGICKDCRALRTPEQINQIYFILGEVHKDYVTQALEFDWWIVRDLVKRIYEIQPNEDFISLLLDYLNELNLSKETILVITERI
jgi:hypothetical protein